MSEKPISTHKHFCLRCGGILYSAKSIARGYGGCCWQIVKPQPIKPYIQETEFVDNGTTEHLAKVYGDLTQWRESF